MAIYNYRSIEGELSANSISLSNGFYNYSQAQLERYFEAMFQFAQTNLSEVSQRNHYNINPARFFYNNRRDVNACARYTRGYYLIEINRGVMENLHKLFAENSSITEVPELDLYRPLSEVLEAEPHSSPLWFLAYQSATLFTFYHELGHLIQFSNLVNNESNAILKQERYVVKNDQPFNILDHIDEYDADNHGAASCAFHILNMWNRLGNQKTNDDLFRLTVYTLVGIIGYIMTLWGDIEASIYYQENDHPHPLIRITWIMAIIVDWISNQGINIDRTALTHETFRVLNIYFSHLGLSDIRDQYLNPLFKQKDEVESYCAYIFNEAAKYPHLVINTVHQAPFLGTNTEQ